METTVVSIVVGLALVASIIYITWIVAETEFTNRQHKAKMRERKEEREAEQRKNLRALDWRLTALAYRVDTLEAVTGLTDEEQETCCD